MSNMEWRTKKKFEKRILALHAKMGEKVTARATSAHAETRVVHREVQALQKEMQKTMNGFNNLDERITDGLRKMGKEQVGRAFQDIKAHTFGDCFVALGYVCLPCKKANHNYA